MDTRALVFSLLVTLGLGCSASHPVEGPDTGAGDLDGGAGDSAMPGDDASPGEDAAAPTDAGVVPECDVPSECTLRPASCCGSCGAATPEDMIALRDDQVDDYVRNVCMDVGCPECAREPDPYLLATCRASVCVAVNLHADPLTECATSADCVLTPAECCACGLLTASQVIAFNPANGSIGSLTCDPDADCPPCVPDFGALTATCSAGRCVVEGGGP